MNFYRISMFVGLMFAILNAFNSDSTHEAVGWIVASLMFLSCAIPGKE